MIYVLHSAASGGERSSLRGNSAFYVFFFTFSASRWQPLYMLKLCAVCYVCYLRCTRDIRQNGGFEVSRLTFFTLNSKC